MNKSKQNQFTLLSEDKLIDLKESLLFLRVSELKEIAAKLLLPDKGKKITLIERIMHFLATGEIIQEPKIPTASCARRGTTYPLAPNALMLKGAYKNDLATRLFFKKLIGNYFHFTAFGIDWLNERWLNGNPPTYQEFADMWVKEYAQRKAFGSPLKEEWAIMNFYQRYSKENGSTSPEEFFAAWREERNKHLAIVKKILSGLM